MESQNPSNKFRNILTIVGVLVVSIFVVLGVYKLQILENNPGQQIVKGFTVNQLPVVPGEPIKWIKTVSVTEINNEQHLLEIPKISSNIKISTSTQNEITTTKSLLTSLQVNKASLNKITNVDRKNLSEIAEKNSQSQASLALAESIKKSKEKGFFAFVSRIFDRIGSMFAAVGDALSENEAEATTLIDVSSIIEPIPPVELTEVISTEKKDEKDVKSENKNDNKKDVAKDLETKNKDKSELIVSTSSDSINSLQEVLELTPISSEENLSTTTFTLDNSDESQATTTIFDKIGSIITSIISPQSTSSELDLIDSTSSSQVTTLPTASSTDIISVEYETPTPVIAEANTDTGKIVTVSAEDTPEEPITDVLAFTNIPEIYKVGQENKIKIKWANNNNQNVTFKAYDLNGNGKLDYIEWTVPHLSTQTFEIIFISKALLLDENKEVIDDIYDQVKAKDNNWANVARGQYIHTTFQKVLTNKNDITLYARPTDLGTMGRVEVYSAEPSDGSDYNGDTNKLLATFNINHTGQYKILLTKLQSPTDVFDLKIIGNVDIDYIVDPICDSISDPLYTVCTYTSDGTFITPDGVTTADILVVGGGGGGGSGNGATGGGGGGDVEYASTTVTVGSYNVVVGDGGAVDNNGASSSFNGVVAGGGGHGGDYVGNSTANGTNGGPGGGGAGVYPSTTGVGGTGVGSNAKNGGDGLTPNGGWPSGGGGGGAGTVGETAPGYTGGAGGDGILINDFGSTTAYYGGGGGGGCWDGPGTVGAGGLGGGGGGGTNAVSGTPNTGGGASGVKAGGTNTATGGSGIVIIKYLTPNTGIVTTDGDYTVVTFNSSGIFVPPEGISEAEILVVGGGGGAGSYGGGTNSYCSGGGGAGDIYYASTTITSGNYNVVVGSGGAVGYNGASSTFLSITAAGGGAGGWSGSDNGGVGQSGGSGGGGGAYIGGMNGGVGVGNMVTNGGNGYGNGSWCGGGGGGGAGTTGGNVVIVGGAVSGGAGGNGIQIADFGTTTYYGGGGGGGNWDAGTYGTGGLGGGGSASPGTPNTGGGGGGISNQGSTVISTGGSGVVIIKYLTPGVITTKYWVGADENWNSASNWASISGGSDSVGVPVAGDTVIFDDGGTGNVNINANVDVESINISSGYTGTITQTSSFTITASSTFSQSDGIFVGVSGDITVGGDVSLLGGSFKSTSGDFSVAGDFTNSGNTFDANGGTITFTGSDSHITPGSSNFYKIIFAGSVSDVSGVGGTPTTDGDYKIHTFTSSGTFVAPVGGITAEVLVVAGGGGGGGTIGGGGGAGGLISSPTYIIASEGSISVTVGDGGLGGFGYNNAGQTGLGGSDSIFGSLTALGGGGGAGWSGYPSTSGGSGGGGSNGGSGSSATQPGSISGGFGNSGADGDNSNFGGGGGGAGTVGTAGTGSGVAIGGAGKQYSQFASVGGFPAGWFAGGGGGGTRNGNGDAGAGGNGGGGTGAVLDSKADNGVANTGGGGGGAGFNGGSASRVGGDGGSGIVIIRYLSGAGAVGTFTLLGNLTATNDITINGGATLNASSSNISLGGDWNNSGTFNANTGTTTFSGTTAILGSSENTFNNINITGTLIATSSNMNILGDWTNSGTFNSNSGTVTFTGSDSHITPGSSSFYKIVFGGESIIASGGTPTTDGDYTIHTFTETETFTPPGSIDAEYLVVAGGGGGGGNLAGGGGAGGMLAGTFTILNSQIITIGAGGNGGPGGSQGTNGENSSIGNSVVVIGGGGGGAGNGSNYNGLSGDSGGGAGCQSGAYGGSGTAGKGNDGGDYVGNRVGAAGGGGAGASGSDSIQSGAFGGDGLQSDISGTLVYYAGGGGGAGWASYPDGPNLPGSGGLGGGGAGALDCAVGSNGTDGLGGGGGGGGCSNLNGGNGGSGIVIIRYFFPIISNVFTLSGNLTATNDITINGGASLNAGSNIISVGGDWNNSGTFNTDTGTVNFTDTTSILGSSENTFNNINITGALTASSSNMNILGDWTNTGTFNANSGTVTFTGTTAIIGSSENTFNNVNISGVLTAPPGNLNVVGDWTNSGTFNSNNGTVIFTGSGLQITSGSSSFNKIIFNGGGSITPGIGGIITTEGDYIVHTFTSSGTFTPPSNMDVEVYAWGAGGAGGTPGGWNYGAPGGAGGASNGTASVSASSYPVIVGGAGIVNSFTGSVGGGGAASNNNSDNRYSGGGGGYSGLFTSSVSQGNAIIIAGGGGGGSASRAGEGNAGGAGGGSIGQVGYSPYDGNSSYAGNPGTQSSAGANASAAFNTGGGGQGALQGGVTISQSYGGGGGGGYWGGSAGGYTEGNTMGGGGGGSGYFNPSYVTSATLTTGSGITPGDSENSLRGDAGNAGTVAGNGSSGIVVIRYLSSGPIIISGNLTATNDITINNDASLNTGSNIISVGGDWNNSGTFNADTGTTTFSGITTFGGSSENTFNNVLITGTLTAPSDNFNVAGNWTNSGTFNANTGTTTFSGTTSILGSSENTFNNINITGTLIATSSNMNILGDWTNSGTFSADTGTTTFSGTTAILGSSENTFNNVSITGFLTATSSNMNIAGDWTNSGTFNANNGTVTFTGLDSQITPGSSSFYKIVFAGGVVGVGTGGTPTTDGDYKIHTFTSDGTFIPPDGVSSVEILDVAGGGSGKGGCAGGGGGGGGGVIYNSSFSVASESSIPVTVGTGGLVGGNGGNSIFSSLTAIGGGVGGSCGNAGVTGGSGGGGGRDSYPILGGSGTLNQGFAGGVAVVSSYGAAGGGGGAGGVGYNGGSDDVELTGNYSQGGIGVQYSISGTPTYYAGGGGGAWCTGGTYPQGGLGGGGHGGNCGNGQVAGTTNTGGGGGGGYSTGSTGGSGIVIIKYLSPGSGNYTLSGNLTVTNDITINSGITLNADSNNISVGGDWTNSGTFNSGTGTTTFNGVSQSLVGDTTFYNFIKSVTSADTLTFGANSTTTIASGGSLMLFGTTGESLSLRSSASPTTWKLDVNNSATVAINYTDVMDSDASSGKEIIPTNATDSGNNLNWNFDIVPPSILLEALSPNPTNNNTPTFYGTSTDSYGTVSNVQFQMDGMGGSWTGCSASDGSFNSSIEAFSCTSPTLSDGSHTIYVRATDNHSNTTADIDATSSTFTIDTVLPVVDAGTDKTKNAIFTQYATTTDATSGIASYLWSKVSGSGDINFGATTSKDTTVYASANDTYVLKLTATDLAGNSASSTFSLIWDITPPTISNISPASSTDILSVGQLITFSLNKFGDCRLATSSKSYDDMSGDTICSTDNGVQISCTAPSLVGTGIKDIYLACEDYLGNKDSALTATQISYVIPAGGRKRPPSDTGGGTITSISNQYGISINNGAGSTNNQKVTLSFSASDGSDATAVVLSTNPDFYNATVISFASSSSFDLCQGNTLCSDTSYTVYAKFVNPYGATYPVISTKINLNAVPIVTEIIDTAKEGANSIASTTSEIISAILPPPKKETVKYPPVEVSVPEVPQYVFSGKWRVSISSLLNNFVFASLPSDFKNIIQKFPNLTDILAKVGITRMNDIGALTTTKISLPGLDETIGVTEKQKLALSELSSSTPGFVGGDLLVSTLSKTQKNKIPTDIVFVRTADQKIDLNVKLSISNSGLALKTVNTIAGKPLSFVIKPEQPAKSIEGYLIFKSNDVNAISVKKSMQTASVLNANESEMTGQNVADNNNLSANVDLVLSQFAYKENSNGIWTAEVVSPQVLGQYELRTIVNFKEKSKASEKISMIVVVDPEGYVFEKLDNGREVRLNNAEVSIYWENPKTKNYELWPAKDFRQINPQITDVTGRYSFLVPVGMYYLKAHLASYSDYQSEPFQVEESKGVFINIEFKAKWGWLRIFNIQNILLAGILAALAYIAIIFTIRRGKNNRSEL